MNIRGQELARLIIEHAPELEQLNLWGLEDRGTFGFCSHVIAAFMAIKQKEGSA